MSALVVAVAGAAGFLLAGLLSTVASARVTATLSAAAGAALTGAGLGTLLGARPPDMVVRWAVPGGALHLTLDAVAAVFLVPLGVLAAACAVYAVGYWTEAEHPKSHRLVRGAFGVLVAAMALVVLAGNGVVFLVGWEAMALAAFVLIVTEHERAEVREAGYVYLAATHAATLLLWILFARVEAVTGTFGFASLPAGAYTDATLLVGLVGFGLKAGFMPLHVWLPGAHASAPTHVSALLSGFLLKVGVYGIVRTAAMTPTLPVAFSALVLVLGVGSALGGVAFALGQHDLKRLLAYHSIENVGIILIGLGLAFLGRSLDRPEWVVLGLAGALLHVWNHAFFKGLLFLAAGGVIHATGTRVMDRLGGLARGMPRTAFFFLVGAVAISGLPPLNGFVSELMIYLGLIRAARPGGSMFVAFAAPMLALVGALAVACFVKAMGATFLGTPRTTDAETPHDPPRSMLWGMGLLATLCAVIGLAPMTVAPALDRAVAAFARGGPIGAAPLPRLASLVPLRHLAFLGAALVAGAGLVALLGRRSLRVPASTETWGCGYAGASSRVQYTGSSFADTLVGILSTLLRPRGRRPDVSGVFPAPTVAETHVDDVLLERVARPAFGRAATLLARVRVIQAGHLNLYILILLVGALTLLLATLPVVPALRALWHR